MTLVVSNGSVVNQEVAHGMADPRTVHGNLQL
jgi:hypothetical protein